MKTKFCSIIFIVAGFCNSVLALTIINKSGRQVTVYYAGSDLCKGYQSRNIRYLNWNDNQEKKMKIKNVCNTSQLGHTHGMFFWGGTGKDIGNGTLYVLFYFDVKTNSPLSIPRLYQLGNPLANTTYIFNPFDQRAKNNPVEIKNNKALTVQFPDPKEVPHAGGFFLD